MGDLLAAAMVLLTFGLLIVTGVYAWLTYQLLLAGREQSWEMARPRLVVALRTNQGGQFIILHIENIGRTPAENLRLTLDRIVQQQFGSQDDIRDAPIFKEGLPSLPPGTRIRVGLGVGHIYLGKDVDRQKHPLRFEVKAQYQSSDRAIEEVFPIDVERQLRATLLDKDYLEEFSRTFPEKFTKEMHRLTKALDGVGRLTA